MCLWNIKIYHKAESLSLEHCNAVDTSLWGGGGGGGELTAQQNPSSLPIPFSMGAPCEPTPFPKRTWLIHRV